jgi:hypothetical protein
LIELLLPSLLPQFVAYLPNPNPKLILKVLMQRGGQCLNPWCVVTVDEKGKLQSALFVGRKMACSLLGYGVKEIAASFYEIMDTPVMQPFQELSSDSVRLDAELDHTGASSL